MIDCLLLRLEAPMTSFGGNVIDNRGVVRDFPGRSMLTGLIGNALGYERHDAALLDALQSRIVEVSVLSKAGRRVRDYQTARLFEKDGGWTTRGRPEGRASSPSFDWDERYEKERGVRMKSLTHQRYRDFDADATTLVALTLRDGSPGPGLDDVEAALERPERPLFIGRKPNLPSGPLARGRVSASSVMAAACDSVHDALDGDTRFQCDLRALPEDVGLEREELLGNAVAWLQGVSLRALRQVELCDERRHVSGVHAGSRTVVQGWIRPCFDALDAEGREARAPERASAP